tara:strand:+ start:550 stop:1683 length:1134 start_codon:yes stop_codon:yes gene_type:complete
MSFIKFLGIIILSFLISSNAHSKKPLKTDIVFESENGAVYSIKLPLFSAGKGRWQPSFDKINNLSQQNCSLYLKDSFLFIAKGKNSFSIKTNGKLKVNAIKTDQGLIPDFSLRMSLKHNYFRFFCAKDIEEALINHSISNKIFSDDIYKFSAIGNLATHYLRYKNNKYIFNVVTDESKKKIAFKLKEISQDQDLELISNKQGIVTGNVARANFGEVINNSKKLCKELGFNNESEKFSECIMEVMEINDAYKSTKDQENILIKRAKKDENIDLKFDYASRSGKKINKESKWTKFWQGAAWILYEHGDEIFKVILDLKYDTNYSGYNTSNKTTNNRSGLRCTGQRVGDMIYENCTGGGVFIRCTTTIIGQMAKRRCREI